MAKADYVSLDPTLNELNLYPIEYCSERDCIVSNSITKIQIYKHILCGRSEILCLMVISKNLSINIECSK